MKQWNVVATAAVVLTLAYVGVCATSLLMGKVDFVEFTQAVVPVLTAWGGYLASLLPRAGA
jgi:hypothetical protein